MEKDLSKLSLLVGPCPECGNGHLQAVSDGERTNFLCRACGACWHPELAWVHRVNPATCSGCAFRAICVGADRPYGDRTTSPGSRVAAVRSTAAPPGTGHPW